MPKVSDSHRRERRRQILRAAWRCYEREGFHRTSIRDICEEAGLSVGAIYSYFGGKEEILEALAEEGWSSSRTLAESVDGVGGTREACVRFLEAALGALDTESGRRSARVDLRLRAECLDVEKLREQGVERLDAWREELARRLEEAEREGAAAGVRKDGTFEGMADLLVALLVGVQTVAALDPEWDPQSMLRGVRALIGVPESGGENSKATTDESLEPTTHEE